MRFTKEELNFLSVFNQCADNKHYHNNKIEIFNTNNKAYFLLKKVDMGFINSIDYESEEQIRVVFEINQLYSILNSCMDSDIIEITSKGVIINSKSTYDLEVFDIEADEFFFNTITGIDDVITDSFTLPDLSELNFCKNFVGEKTLNTIAVFNSYFVASNQTNYSCILKSNTTFAKDLYFPGDFIRTLSMFDTSESGITFDLSEEFFIFRNGDFKIISSIKDDYILPNLREDQYITMYNFPDEIVIEKSDILNPLKRLSYVSQSKYGNRVLVKFENNVMSINNIDVINATEEFTVQYPDSLNNQSFYISVSNLIKAISSFSESTIKIKLSNNLADSYICTVCNTDETKYILLNMYE